jgi:D-alanyl-D-alanine carboxypeptidase (penicillin-binding protein 5/6)
VGLDEAVVLTVPRGAREQLKAEIELLPVIEAPVTQGQSLGTLVLSLDDEVLIERPVVALNAVQEAGFFASLLDDIQLMFLDLSGGDPLAP